MKATKVVEYKLVSGQDATKLTEVVQRNINEGWQPYGSPFLKPNVSDPRFYQAITRTDWPQPKI